MDIAPIAKIGIPRQLESVQPSLEQLGDVKPSPELSGHSGSFATLLAAVVVIVTLWGAGEKEQQQVLYSQLNMQDAGAIAAKLKEMKVPYTLKGDGTTILAPAAMVLDARLRLATEGLPQGGGVGYEVFGNSPLGGMTDFMQKLNYRRGVLGKERPIIEREGAAVRHG